jgi:uncharacterized protein (DUF1501 family)
MARLHAPSRRKLLLASGSLFAWAYLPKLARAEGRDPRFLTIVLRGALDGLATVAPVGDPDWVSLRGDNALTLDSKTSALKLDDFFALNPAMPNLHRMFKANEAIVVHAAATSYRERSHFDGQDVLESGVEKLGAIRTGWLNRLLVGLAPEDRVRSNATAGTHIIMKASQLAGWRIAGRARWGSRRRPGKHGTGVARDRGGARHRVRPHRRCGLRSAG